MAENAEESFTLSADSLAALQQFYTERDEHTNKFERLKAQVEAHHQDREAQKLSIHSFTEDWNESQFWYSDDTANLLANQLLDGVNEDSVIAVVSTPSVFVALRNILSSSEYTGPKPKTFLLEHDQRFGVFPEFIFYDFAEPFKLPSHLKGSVDRMICDGPFLNENCQTKMAMTMRWLARNTIPPRLIICTGERMETLVDRLWYKPLGVRTTTYLPLHRGGLSNEFYCYANFECEAWEWKQEASAVS
ncbi:putative N6-adenine methyltransferase-domain-containing protein [Xylariaceae sp. FL1019]|nr:putative N6-adenine methyltransferase-domain-containing protein [Xylariaceae sp. FL1019]